MSSKAAKHEQKHATPKQYVQIAIVLTVITIFEVAYPYATHGFTSLHAIYMPLLGILSAIKFGLVVAFYMHLRYDIRLLQQIFLFTLFVAFAIATSLFFLFHVL